ncbi:hypothetical protein EB796_021116 [Bugula neritina]|uniref:Uncharacterized protein n=1 Tax=Bugula neritina TaxID=10212 RepID=A0A7J7J325_BUGNE|nr:hypothetical protein EB796_021116 [Bugula neritina]
MVESGRKEEDVLDSLLACGIGKESGSTIGISPLSVCLGGADVKKVKTLRDDAETTPATDKNSTKIGTTPSPALSSSKPADSAARVGFEPTTETSEESENLLCKAAADESEADLEQDGESEFMKSVKARIVIQPVMASLKKNAEFTFDYLLFIILASVISAIGLIENNSVILVASMLISPLMGPILAATFGAVVKDRGLQNVGIKSELIGLALCVCTGFLIGLPVVFLVTTEGPVLPSTLSWPAPEMFNRGLPRSLVTGIIIAFVSGMAVALSVLGDNQGSLVGVAISASLLPPAVNAGLLWAYSFRSAIVLPETVMPTHPTSLNITSNSSTLMENNKLGGLQCPDLVSNTYSPQFSCNMAQETFYLGLFSLLLTILNIIMIVIAAVCCLKVKQVSPRASVQGEKSFWTEHMVVAKHYNTTIRPDTDIWKALKQDMKTELGLSDKDVERLDDAGNRSAAVSMSNADTVVLKVITI